MGKLIVLEGTDGSGKSTQFRFLSGRLEQEGTAFRRLVFPQYDKESSALIRMYLHGDFGMRPGDVNAYAASTFYAVDRYASYRQGWKRDYDAGTLILADRYTTSNAVHQGAKEPPERRRAFFDWLRDLEYRRMGLPAPDLVVYLDVPTEVTAQLMREREQATGTHADIHEADNEYLRTCRAAAAEAADYYGWTKIQCVRDGILRTKEDIHQEIYGLVKACMEE
ncbi:MAG: thymidylate kinase [Oscillospiraceae bacterium]|nr:thymidylate kinase [Oscillospiraceae bacterium]